MTQLRYIGSHRPTGMIVDIAEDRVKDALKTGEFERLGVVEKTLKEEVKKKIVFKKNSK